MRDPTRIDRILNKIREVWIQQPDTRLFQLLLNTGIAARTDGSNYDWSIYYIEDDKLEDVISNLPTT